MAKSIFFKSAKVILSSILLLGIIEISLERLSQAQVQDRNPVELEIPQQEDAWETYWDAVEDASTPEPEEVFRDLTAITRDNQELTWGETGRLLVVYWTKSSRYIDGKRLIPTQDLWVTVAPKLQIFCKNYTRTNAPRPKPDQVSFRLNQLLGLPPEDDHDLSKRKIVELWVDPQFLFRPSPDPEITDHEAELTFRTITEFMPVSFSYQQWFYDEYANRYLHEGRFITLDRVPT